MTLGELSGLGRDELVQIGKSPGALRELSQCAVELEEAGKIFVGLNHPAVGSLFAQASDRTRRILEEAKAACPQEQSSSAQAS